MGFNDSKYSWVDVSKGMVICLMVIGHTSLPTLAGRWIWSFHMPFFFIVSALFTNWERSSSRNFITRKSKVLLLPFVVYSMINLAAIPYALGESHLEYAKGILCNGWGGIALWFVPVFFAALTICKTIPERFVLQASVVLLVVGAMLDLNGIIAPWTLSSVPFGTALMLLARRFKEPIMKWISSTQIKYWVVSITLGLFVSLFISNFYRLDMACNQITPVIPILAGIIAGTAFCFGLSHVLDRIPVVGRLFRHIGHNTYEVMALSQATIMLCNRFAPNLALGKYAIMVMILIVAVYLRKCIEGRFSKVEAI